LRREWARVPRRRSGIEPRHLSWIDALRRHVAPLVERAPSIRLVLVAWFAIHAFVSTKVGWILRPFVGDPALPVEFLRADRWSEDPFANLFWTVVGLAASLARRLLD